MEEKKHVVADAGFIEALAGALEPVEVRNSHGMVIGHYTPVVDARQAELHARHSHIWDLEEADRIAATERDGLPLAEVWKRLGVRGEGGCG
jgi:hypothetical protein